MAQLAMLNKYLMVETSILLTLKVCERLANIRKVVFGYGYQNEPAVLGNLSPVQQDSFFSCSRIILSL